MCCVISGNGSYGIIKRKPREPIKNAIIKKCICLYYKEMFICIFSNFLGDYLLQVCMRISVIPFDVDVCVDSFVSDY